MISGPEETGKPKSPYSRVCNQQSPSTNASKHQSRNQVGLFKTAKTKQNQQGQVTIVTPQRTTFQQAKRVTHFERIQQSALSAYRNPNPLVTGKSKKSLTQSNSFRTDINLIDEQRLAPKTPNIKGFTIQQRPKEVIDSQPGVGTYNTLDDRSVSRKSSNTRFVTAPRDTSDKFILSRNSPGPGSYRSEFVRSNSVSTISLSARFQKVPTSPGPADYSPARVMKQLARGIMAASGRQENIWVSKEKQSMPGPGAHNPHPLLNTPKKVSMGLPRVVRIDLTPGVGQYEAKPVLRKSPNARIPTAKKTSIFDVQSHQKPRV